MISTAALLAIINLFTALAGDKDLIQKLADLATGPVSEGRDPTDDEWSQMNALADQAHADVQNG